MESTFRSGRAFEQNIVAQRSSRAFGLRHACGFGVSGAAGGGGRGNADAPSASGTTATRVFLRDSWDRRGGARGRVRGRSRARRLALRTPRACLSKCREARGRGPSRCRRRRHRRRSRRARRRLVPRARAPRFGFGSPCRRDRARASRPCAIPAAPRRRVPAAGANGRRGKKCVRVRVNAHDLVRTSSCRFRVRGRNASGYLDSRGRRAARREVPSRRERRRTGKRIKCLVSCQKSARRSQETSKVVRGNYYSLLFNISPARANHAGRLPRFDALAPSPAILHERMTPSELRLGGRGVFFTD